MKKRGLMITAIAIILISFVTISAFDDDWSEYETGDLDENESSTELETNLNNGSAFDDDWSGYEVKDSEEGTEEINESEDFEVDYSNNAEKSNNELIKSEKNSNKNDFGKSIREFTTSFYIALVLGAIALGMIAFLIYPFIKKTKK
tara:strand:+ start:1983 stop:2420 length:438 start_codon:yes stop_codon:yes gene_type:complete